MFDRKGPFVAEKGMACSLHLLDLVFAIWRRKIELGRV